MIFKKWSPRSNIPRRGETKSALFREIDTFGRPREMIITYSVSLYGG